MKRRSPLLINPPLRPPTVEEQAQYCAVDALENAADMLWSKADVMRGKLDRARRRTPYKANLWQTRRKRRARTGAEGAE